MKKIKPIFITIFLLFIFTRLALGAIYLIQEEKLPLTDWKEQKLYNENHYLSSWAVWDSEWYLKIAEYGYVDTKPFVPSRYSSVGFFPLYPAIMSTVAIFVKDYLIAGLLVSNAFFLISAYLLYLLVKEDDDETTAKRSVYYLFLFPFAFIFSSVYPESLLLCAWLACILAARREYWLLAGLAGFAAAMTKPLGFLIVIPALLIYLQNKNFAWRNFHIPDFFKLVLIPAGLLVTGLIDYAASGDIMAYSHVQQGAWEHHFSNPFATIYEYLFHQSFDWSFNAVALVMLLIILCAGYKKIPFTYWIFGLLALMFIPTNGVVICVLRYSASIFPLIIILTKWGKNEIADRIIITSMTLLQGCLFLFWVAGYWFAS